MSDQFFRRAVTLIGLLVIALGSIGFFALNYLPAAYVSPEFAEVQNPSMEYLGQKPYTPWAKAWILSENNGIVLVITSDLHFQWISDNWLMTQRDYEIEMGGDGWFCEDVNLVRLNPDLITRLNQPETFAPNDEVQILEEYGDVSKIRVCKSGHIDTLNNAYLIP